VLVDFFAFQNIKLMIISFVFRVPFTSISAIWTTGCHLEHALYLNESFNTNLCVEINWMMLQQEDD